MGEVEDQQYLEDMESNIKYTLKISYYGTKENKAIVDKFLEYSKTTDNVRLQAIRRLLEMASSDWKYEELSMRISELSESVLELHQQKQLVEEPVVQKKMFKSFGSDE